MVRFWRPQSTLIYPAWLSQCCQYQYKCHVNRNFVPESDRTNRFVFARFCLLLFFCSHETKIHASAAELWVSLVTPITKTNSCTHSYMASDLPWGNEWHCTPFKKNFVAPSWLLITNVCQNLYKTKTKKHAFQVATLLFDVSLTENHSTSTRAQRASLNNQVPRKRY